MTEDQWHQMFAIVGPIMISGTVMIGGATWYLAKAIEGVRQAALQVSATLGERIAKVEARLDAQERLMMLLPEKR